MRLFSLCLVGVGSFLGVLTCPPYLKAQTPICGVEGSDEFSPLFLNRNDLRRTRSSDEKSLISWNEISTRLPAIQPHPDSLLVAFRTITQDVDRGLHRATTQGKPCVSLTLEPTQFRLQERREISVTLTLRNESSCPIRLLFPTSQRMELLTRDSRGNIIQTYSDNRKWEFLEEIVIVNPHETIQYSQQIPTREMRAGEAYTIEASLFNNPQYTQTGVINPK